jgi:hypothetical protein
MTAVFLINVGANTSDSGKARSPVFRGGSFVYVPFTTKTSQGPPGYSAEALPFVRNVGQLNTHADPDWTNLTYGDKCSNFRAAALMTVADGDILLFWGLLWKNRGTNWSGFTGQRGWYLMGALRVEEIAEPGQSLQHVSGQNRNRASQNAHFRRSTGRLPQDERVFLGAAPYSAKFAQAVDLQVHDHAGLMYQAFTSAAGNLLQRDTPPHWGSSLRSCRRMWDLAIPTERTRATLVRDAIRDRTGFDLLAHV